jgi:hypothetical protein
VPPQDLAHFAQDARVALRAGRIAETLERVCALVEHVNAHDLSTAQVFSSALLDALCLEAGAIRSAPAPTQDRRGIVIVATHLMRAGAHSRQIADIIQADPARPCTVLITGVRHDGQLDTTFARDLLAGATVETAPSGSLAAKLGWLTARMATLSPTRTYLFSHQFDSVAVAAMQPALTGQLVFFHHADHNLTLGAALRHGEHVDFHPKGFWRCRDAGVADNVVWPITADVESAPHSFAHLGDGGTLTTCCSGAFAKFELPAMIEPARYAVSYPDTVCRTLAITGGVHHHIGGLSAAMQAAIAATLDGAGIDPARFVLTPLVPSLADALRERGVDLYMGSVPRGGGRSLVEAMGVGLPLLLHSNYRSIHLSDENEAYPGAPTWRTLAELELRLRALEVAELTRQAAAAHDFYRAHHSPGAMIDALRALIDGVRLPPPPRPHYRGDALQAFLDREAASPHRG